MNKEFFCRDLSKMEVEYAMTNQRIERLLSSNNVVGAARECYSWADVVARKLAFSYNNNWKVFKKEFIARFFGAPPSITFTANMESNLRLEEFIRFYSGKNMRMTVHTDNEACHSKSILLKKGLELEMFMVAQKQLRGQDCIVVFPESSDDNSICFRCSVTDNAQKVFFEGGYGQACLSFENERGLHPVASIECNTCKFILESSGDCSIKEHLYSLIVDHWNYLVDTARRAIRFIGADYISVEGYYNYVLGVRPIIVDCDLPFDKVFFRMEKNA